jgi:hypothetical protein
MHTVLDRQFRLADQSRKLPLALDQRQIAQLVAVMLD